MPSTIPKFGERSLTPYASLAERIRAEWKIYLVALVFAVVASAIGQISIPLGPGTLILFPIFYSLILGILSGPSVAKIFKTPQVKAASKLVIVAICPFIAKLGINAGASLDTVISAGPALFAHAVGDVLTILIAVPVALPLAAWLYRTLEPRFAAMRHEPSAVLAEREAAGSGAAGAGKNDVEKDGE